MLNNVLFMLLGAGLVTVGVLVAALADRLYGERLREEPPEHPEGPRQERRAPRTAVITIDPSVLPRMEGSDAPLEMPRVPAVTRTARVTRKAAPSLGDDVITALIAAGYKRPVAAAATWACREAERVTIENWTASALRRCGRGVLNG